MDKETEKRLDAIVEDEVQKGYRLKEFPKHLQERLQEEGGPAVSWVRFTRLNPARRRKIAALVQGQYHRDFRNPDVMSTEQLKKLAEDRGEWTPAHEARLKVLQEAVNRRTSALYFADSPNDVILALAEQTTKLRLAVVAQVAEETQELLLRLFDRWLNFNPERQAEYDTEHGPDQNRQRYSPDSDFQRVQALANSHEISEILFEVERLRDQVHDLVVLNKDRRELYDLQSRYARIFAESAEQRRETTEELARIYFTTERCTEEGKPLGPLTSAYDDMENLPEDAIQWFQVENFFFHNNIPDEAREYLHAVGFPRAEPAPKTENSSEPSASEASDASPVPPNSKDDSRAAEPMRVISSESEALTS